MTQIVEKLFRFQPFPFVTRDQRRICMWGVCICYDFHVITLHINDILRVNIKKKIYLSSSEFGFPVNEKLLFF